MLPADDAGSDASLDCLPAPNYPKATPQGCQGLVQSSVQFRFMSSSHNELNNRAVAWKKQGMTVAPRQRRP
ncbi:hypothetical protein T03_7090 [Trichinella britovi]|uniref:Uncharacterized protein n=1 Tax=Trichinella britovi TaxID=45882 RepID=A0A0V1D8Y5_TRIBR|nr:hypothetical protein T06_9714 [Trichinella sp. T6]KRX54159.1 hypothetical protein T09_1690 [Trichinella sp. T9]KRY57860.1 hypothetical protein T03_7090 [Trichinella britovi]